MKYLKVLIVNYDKDNKVNKEKIINKVNKSYKSSSVAKTRNKIYIYIIILATTTLSTPTLKQTYNPKIYEKKSVTPTKSTNIHLLIFNI